MCDTEGVYRRLYTTKNCSKDIKRRNFSWCQLLQTPGKEIAKRRKRRGEGVIILGICANLW